MTADSSSSPSRQHSRLHTIVAALAVVTVVVGATFWVTDGDPFVVFDSSLGPCAIETRSESVEAAAPALVRENLSAEPVLQWTRVNAPGHDIGRLVKLHALSSGLVLARVDDEGHERVLWTLNGADWDELPTPAGIAPELVRHAAGRWVIAGPDLTAPAPTTERAEAGIEQLLENDDRWQLDRVATSTDDGATWKEIPVNTQTSRHFREKDLFSIELMTSQDRIVLATLVRPELHLDEVLTSRGVLEEDEDAHSVAFVDGAFAVAIRQRGTLEIARLIDVPLEDLDLTERDLELVDWWESLIRNRHRGRIGYVRVYAGDADGLELAAEFDSEWASGVATTDAFFLAHDRQDPRAVLYLGSRDGRDWDEVYSTRWRLRQPLPGVSAAAHAWAMVSNGDGRQLLVAIGCDRTPVPVAAFTPPDSEGRWVSETVVHSGPVGLVAIESYSLVEVSELEVPRSPLSANDASENSTETVEIIETVETTQRLLWSRDGRTWSLFHLPDVPGADDPHPSVHIAIGQDFVLAAVTPQGMNPVWFVAEAP